MQHGLRECFRHARCRAASFFAGHHRNSLLKQNRYGIVLQVRDGEIELAVAVEIRCQDLVRTSSDYIRRTRCLGEGPVAIAKQQRDGAVSIVCDREVQFAVAIEISGYDSGRTISYRDRGGRPKGSIAIAEQNEHRVASGISHREIQLPITIKVGRHDRGETLPEGNG